VANYVLRPGEEYVGTWHIEGMVSTSMDFNSLIYLILITLLATRTDRRIRDILLRRRPGDR
jgi:hypothetical protein